MKTFLFLLALVLSVPLSRGQEGSAPATDESHQIHWQRTLEDALALQRSSGRPIFVAINTDAESASERIVRELYRDPEFVEKTRSFVCVIASPLRHTPRDFDGRGRRAVDPRFGEVTSGEAQALEPAAFERWLGGERIAPRHALVLADGSVAFDLFQLWDLAELDRRLGEAVQQHGGPIELEPAAPEKLAARTEERLEQWRALARARSNRNRARFESLLASAQVAYLPEALDAIAAHGDAGSIDALRILLARSAPEGERFRSRLAETARKLSLGGQFAFALWEQLLRVDDRPLEPGLARQALLLPLAGELCADLAAQPATFWIPDPALSSRGLRSLLLSYLATGAQGAGLEREMAAQALERALGAAELARVEAALAAEGGAFDLPALARFAADREAPELPPVPAETLRDEDALGAELLRLEAASAQSTQDPELALARGRAALELARARLARGGEGADLLLVDALEAFEVARAAQPADVGLRLEQARAAYELGRFEDEERFALEALDLLAPQAESSETWIPWEERVPATDELVEAHRWLGDAAARLSAQRFGGDPAIEAVGMLRAARSLALAAAGPEAGPTDWVSLASWCGALGRRREELAFARLGVLRHPESDDLRAALQRACAATSRPDLLTSVAEELERSHPQSAACVWYLGHALVGAAEWSRRAEEPARAVDAYARADDAFQRSAELEPGFAQSALHYRAMCALGTGFARLLLDEQAAAADALVQGIAQLPSIAAVRDGLDREALDLLDGALEWRAAGPSPVGALELAARLLAADPGNAAWPRAVSDSELREALRAAGRSAPEAEVERWLDTSIQAGRQALELDPEGEASRRALAQALTIRAERLLAREGSDLTQTAILLEEAAPLAGLEAPVGDERRALQSCAEALRGWLGEARPVNRPGR
jgi:hypothetical protein